MWLRFLLAFVLPNALFVAFSLVTDAIKTTPLISAAILSLAVGVCVAYTPAVWDAFFGRRPRFDDGDWLSLGIFISWGSVVVQRAWSITWFALGRPDWLLENDLLNYALFMQMCAAVCHLRAPSAVGGRVPTRWWIDVGAIAAIGVFVLMLVAYLTDTTAMP